MTAPLTDLQQAIAEGTPSISLPLWQILLFIACVSAAAIMGKHRTIALICYAFLFHLFMRETIPVYAMNQPSVITLSVACLLALAGLIATCYQMLHNSD